MMIELCKEAWKEAKANPVEVIGSTLLLTGLFAFLYVALWVVCPC